MSIEMILQLGATVGLGGIVVIWLLRYLIPRLHDQMTNMQDQFLSHLKDQRGEFLKELEQQRNQFIEQLEEQRTAFLEAQRREAA